MEYKRIPLITQNTLPVRAYFVNCFVFTFLLGTSLLIFMSYTDTKEQLPEITSAAKFYYEQVNITIEPFLINTPKCKIPQVHPFNEEVRQFFSPKEYFSCSDDKPLLTYIEKKNNVTTLNVNQSLVPLYAYVRVSCCYSAVTRSPDSARPDDSIEISDCKSFTNSVVITKPIIKVTCKNLFLWTVYSNVHAIVSLQNVSEKTYKQLPDPGSNPSVMLVGIDSISKLNLIRTMPRTYKFLEHNDFISLKGYTKVGLNTLPNFLGIFSGRTLEQAKEICDYANHIDDCPLIWEKFKEMEYITGYGEDAPDIGSFNYEKKGFERPPTDFYFRPYILAAERLKLVIRNNMDYCAGPETSAERIMNLAKDFQITLKEYRKFGLFWMNTFSHDSPNMPSAMDERVETFLQDFYRHLDNTIFFFFSDHGFRFGKLRRTETGWLEDRIPFFYVHFPETFKKKFPREYKNFQINSQRLTCAFDIFMTLQHILLLANPKYTIEQSVACPKCHSLFEEVSDQRTCWEAAIEEKYCVCNAHTYINKKDKRVQKAAKLLMENVNELIQTFPNGDKCQSYQVDKIVYAGISYFNNKNNKTGTSLLLRVQTRPNVTFEGSIDVSNLPFRMMGEISRLNRYAPYVKCIHDIELKKYCYCKDVNI